MRRESNKAKTSLQHRGSAPHLHQPVQKDENERCVGVFLCRRDNVEVLVLNVHKGALSKKEKENCVREIKGRGDK